MLITAAIICIIHSASALFHHSKLPLHSKFHLHAPCQAAPLTLFKVLKNIHECQHEVKSSIFNEAFTLIKEHAFHHPHEHHSLNVHDLLHHHDSHHHDHQDHHHDRHQDDHFADRNFTLTEQEILRFFEENDHSSGSGFGLFGHDPGVIPVPSAGPPLPLSYHDPGHSIYNHHFLHADSAFKKTDAAAADGEKAKLSEPLVTLADSKPMDSPSSQSTAPKKTDYTYFNVRAAKSMDSERPETETDEHRRYDAWLHPTTATFKDKRIAGCLMHCLYEKDHAVDPHTGFPTLDGLVHFHSDGVHEHGFFMATLRAADSCLKGAVHKYHVDKPHSHHSHHHHRLYRLDAGSTCDLAFDIFDCVSDAVTDYCNHHHGYDPFHNHHHEHYDAHHHLYPHHHHHQHYPDYAYDYFHNDETPFLKK